ncbi:MAG: hypothetical protein IH840_07520 [Candidatus Heimdallarchaeota archaeon]|nr:hypothetical protein [Candidatus Heimdallarchaeota archaeon]
MGLSNNEKYVGIIIVVVILYIVINPDFGTVETGTLWNPQLTVNVIDANITNQTDFKLFEMNTSMMVVNGSLTINSLSIQTVNQDQFGDEKYSPVNKYQTELTEGVNFILLRFELPQTLDVHWFRMNIDFSYRVDGHDGGGKISIIVETGQ